MTPVAGNACARCCQDMTVRLREVADPEGLLDARGRAFMRAHGFLGFAFGRDEMLDFDHKGTRIRIRAAALFMPDVHATDDERQFIAGHQLRELVRGDEKVVLRHRCMQLTKDGLCAIYSTRPEVCREFACSGRADCTEDMQPPLPKGVIRLKPVRQPARRRLPPMMSKGTD